MVTETYTQFGFAFEDSPMLSNQSETLFYPLQWTRVCLSKDSITSLARMVVDGELLVEEEVRVKSQPDKLDLVLGITPCIGDECGRGEYPNRITNLNIFSSALTVEQMKSQTRPGERECGLTGDFLG